MEDNIILLGMAVNVFIFLALILTYATRVKRAGPNQAIIVSGRLSQTARITDEGVPFRVIVGGRTFVWPILEKAEVLSLEPVRADLKLDNIMTGDGRRISPVGKIQYRVPAEHAAVIKAAQYFLSKTEAEKSALVMDMIESNFRRVVEESSQEEIEQSPMKFGDRVIEAGRPEMEKMGIEVMSLVITGV